VIYNFKLEVENMKEETFWIITEAEEDDCKFNAVPVTGKTMTRACLDIVMADDGINFTAVAVETVRMRKMEAKR